MARKNGLFSRYRLQRIKRIQGRFMINRPVPHPVQNAATTFSFEGFGASSRSLSLSLYFLYLVLPVLLVSRPW